jgi:hypothetical protein
VPCSEPFGTADSRGWTAPVFEELRRRQVDRSRGRRGVGLDPGRAAYVKAKPRVKAYMDDHRASVRVGLVQHEVDTLVEFNIGREQLLAKWWEFANIDPKLTGYNTSGQSKALDSLWKALGFEGSKKTGDEDEPEPERPQIYRAKWMRKPGDPDYEDEEEETSGGQVHVLNRS